MDASVIAAVAKWPDVPAVYGWLGLTGRGEWRLRGERIDNEAIRDYIGRNYASDERGCWFFQNGPQRVFVDLEVAPWVWRIATEERPCVRAHTGVRALRLRGAWLDDAGHLFIQTDVGFGLVDSADAAGAVECCRTDSGHRLEDSELEGWLAGRGPGIALAGRLLGLDGDAELCRLRSGEAPERFRYVRAPQPG
jgi:hypothetical protein